MLFKIKSAFIFPFSLFLLLILISGCSETKQDPNYDKAVTENNKRRAADTLLRVQRDSIETKKDSLFDNVKIVAADSVAKTSASKEEMTEDIKDKIRINMNKIFSVYIDIKDELTDNDSTDAKKEAQELMNTIMKAQTDVGQENISKRWRLSSDKIKTASDKIQAATTLASQRTLFNTLTQSMFEAIKEHGLDGKTVYQLTCASALSGNGGMWLTDSKDSDNPYAGVTSKDIDSRSCVKITGAWKYE